MLETHIRPLYQRLLVAPVANRLGERFTPNHVSLTSLAVGLCAALAIGFGQAWLALALLLISGYLDTLDGTIARMTHQTSDFGSMLDITCDRMVEIGIIIGLFALAPDDRAWLCIGMMASVLLVVTTFLTAGIFIPNDGHKSFNYTPGLMERPEAFTFFVLMIFVPQYFAALASLFIILVLYTAALRLWQARRILQADS